MGSDAVFRALSELPDVGMVHADSPSFNFSQVNQKLCAMTGYSAEELQTKTFIGLTDPRERRSAMKELARVLRGSADSWSLAKRWIRKDGSIIWVEVNGTAVRDESGRTIRILAMVTDLTARRHGEKRERPAAKPHAPAKSLKAPSRGAL